MSHAPSCRVCGAKEYTQGLCKGCFYRHKVCPCGQAYERHADGGCGTWIDGDWAYFNRTAPSASNRK